MYNRKLKRESIYVYPLFLAYRIIFEFIPVIQKTKSGYQVVILIYITLVYYMILFGLQTNLKN